jgi:hypothetical protein
LSLPVVNDDFRPLGGAFAEDLLDFAARLINRRRESGNHLRQFHAIVLMERADQRRFQVGRELEIPNVEPGLHLRQRKALLVAEIQCALSLATPFDDLKGYWVKVALVILDGRKR